MGIALGLVTANWIEYAGLYASGNLKWRIPLAMQFRCAVFLLIGSIFVPFSPRWLVSRDRFKEARQILEQIHSKEGQEFIDREMIQVREQIGLERTYNTEGPVRGFVMLFNKRYIKRVAYSCFVRTATQFAGVGVIQNFQSIFYAAVGFEGNTALLISAIYGFMGVIGQATSLTLVADKWKRTSTLWIGCLVLAVNLAICMALSAEFSNGSNLAASRATIAFIFLYSCCYAVFFNSTTWVVSSELLPIFLRSKGLGLATFCNGAASIMMSQITPVAMDNISWRYYAVFIAANAGATAVYFFLLPETKGLSLEETGALFGDEMATARLDDIDVNLKLRLWRDVAELAWANMCYIHPDNPAWRIVSGT